MTDGRLLAALIAAACVLGLPATSWAQAFTFQMEGGTVLKRNTYQDPTWETVNLTYTYDSPIIVAIPNTNGNHPADFRIRNVTNTSFELTLAEPFSEDGPHVEMVISYVVVEAGQWVLPDGAHAVEAVTRSGRMKTIGHVTSSYWSPTLKRSIAMALIRRGPERMGEVLSFPVEPGKVIRAKVVDPVFLDPENARQKV